MLLGVDVGGTFTDAVLVGEDASVLGWERIELDPMHVVVKLPAKRPTGQVDHYYFLLGAEYYDAAPPTVTLVKPDDWTHAPGACNGFLSWNDCQVGLVFMRNLTGRIK